jgi:hypothetical protein
MWNSVHRLVLVIETWRFWDWFYLCHQVKVGTYTIGSTGWYKFLLGVRKLSKWEICTWWAQLSGFPALHLIREAESAPETSCFYDQNETTGNARYTRLTVTNLQILYHIKAEKFTLRRVWKRKECRRNAMFVSLNIFVFKTINWSRL